MKRLHSLLILFSTVLLAGCQASGDSKSASEARPSGENPRNAATANEARPSGGIPRVVRPDPITVPEGATLALVLVTPISSATSKSGDRVLATLADDVRAGERVVVPAGTEVRGLVTAAVPSGRVKTRARLAFAFDTLVLAGKEHSIGTSPIDITAGDTHTRDAATIGIGAGAGAVVGGIIDGKKGAGIGALIGGVTGTGVVLNDTGKEVQLGSGARVTVTVIRETRL